MESRLSIQCLELGPLQTNCYVVADPDSKEALVVDPADEGETIWKTTLDHGLILKHVVFTHGHFDHIGGAEVLASLSNKTVMVHKDDAGMLTDNYLNLSALAGFEPVQIPCYQTLLEGMVLSVGTLQLHVLHTPGHSPGSISLVGEGVAIVGDVLFQGSVGRTDFPNASSILLMNSIHNKLLILDDATLVLPGHGPSTTIGYERKENPFLERNQSYI